MQFLLIYFVETKQHFIRLDIPNFRDAKVKKPCMLQSIQKLTRRIRIEQFYDRTC